MTCPACGGPIGSDDIGLYKKLVNRGATDYICRVCLAKRFGVEVSLLEQKIAEFRAAGCHFFPRTDETSEG